MTDELGRAAAGELRYARARDHRYTTPSAQPATARRGVQSTPHTLVLLRRVQPQHHRWTRAWQSQMSNWAAACQRWERRLTSGRLPPLRGRPARFVVRGVASVQRHHAQRTRTHVQTTRTQARVLSAVCAGSHASTPGYAMAWRARSFRVARARLSRCRRRRPPPPATCRTNSSSARRPSQLRGTRTPASVPSG